MIPYQVEKDGWIYSIEQGLLPDYIRFGLAGLAIFVILLILTLRRFKQKLLAPLVIRQLNKTISPILLSRSAYFAIVFIVYQKYSFIQQNSGYFLILLGLILLFEFCCKWLIQYLRPEKLAIDNQTIIYKSFLRIKHLSLENLNQLTVDYKKKSVQLHFREGLENIFLYHDDYKSTELKLFLKEIINRSRKDLPRMLISYISFPHSNQPLNLIDFSKK